MEKDLDEVREKYMAINCNSSQESYIPRFLRTMIQKTTWFFLYNCYFYFYQKQVVSQIHYLILNGPRILFIFLESQNFRCGSNFMLQLDHTCLILFPSMVLDFKVISFCNFPETSTLTELALTLLLSISVLH
jgi:hypothetical protein